MPAPQDVRLNYPLTTFAVGYRPSGFIADMVLPPLPVAKESGTYLIRDKANFRAAMDGPRSSRDPSRRADFGASSTTYTVDNYNLSDVLPDRDRDNFPLGPDAAAQAWTSNLIDRMLVGKEIRAAALAFSGTYVTTNTTLSGTSQWSDFSNSNPITNLDTAASTVSTACGKPISRLKVAMGEAVWLKVKRHPTITEAFKYTAGGAVQAAQLANLIGVSEVIVGGAKYNSADEGQTDTLANVWGKHCLVYYADPAPAGLDAVTLGAAITLTGKDVSNGQVTTWRNQDPPGDNIKVDLWYTHKIISTACGYLIINAVA